jgi:predicted small lipoprotein YifL
VTLVLAATGLLANCGQKGALVLPGPETTTAVEEGNPADEDNDAQDSE